MDRPLSNQQKSVNRNKRIKAVFYAGFVAVGIWWLVQYLFSPSVSLHQIRTATVEQGVLKSSINAGGVVVPQFEETLISEISGRILQVLVQPGQRVEVGQPILRIDTQNITLQLAQLKEQIALKENQIITEQVLFEQAKNDIQSRIELFEVDLQIVEAKAARISKLNQIGSASEQELLDANLTVKRKKIELKQLRQSIQDKVTATESRVKGLQMEKSILYSQTNELNRLSDSALVTASRAGVISWLMSEEGASVNAQQPVAKIADDKHFKVEATLSDFYSQQLTPGMDVEVIYRDQRFQGQLESQVPSFENGLMKLVIALNHGNTNVLKNRLRVDVELITNEIPNTLKVTKGPFINGRGQHPVFVIQGDEAIRTTAAFGVDSSEHYQVLSGITAGDKIIISDTQDLIHLEKFRIN